MRRLLGMIISLGVAGVFLDSASALAQAQKATEPAVAKMPPRPRDLESYRKSLDSLFRQYFVSEYYFIRNVCSPTPEQAKVIAREGERAYQKMILERAKLMQRARNTGDRSPLDDVRVPRRTIRDALARIAKDHLSVQQFERLQGEYARRTASWREAGIEAILDSLDKELILGADQREAIRRSLVSHWQDSWILSPDYFLYRQYPTSPFPVAYVVEFLTANQRKALEELQKAPIAVTIRLADTPIPSIHEAGGPLEDDALREAYRAELQVREAAKQTDAKEVPR